MDIFDPQHPKSPRLTSVPVRESCARSNEPYDIIKAVIDVFNILKDYGAFTRHEVPIALVQSYHLDYYVTQVNNGGHEQFAGNSGWSADIQQDVEQALGEIGASELKEIFMEVARYINADPHRRAAILARRGFDHPVHGKVDDWIKRKDSEFFSQSNSITSAHGKWLKSLECLTFVPDLEWKFKVSQTLDSNMLLDERLIALGRKKRDFLSDLTANAPLKKTYFEYASELAKSYGIELPFLPKDNWKEQHEGKEIWNTVFETKSGDILVIFFDLDIIICNLMKDDRGKLEIVLPPIGFAKMERQEV